MAGRRSVRLWTVASCCPGRQQPCRVHARAEHDTPDECLAESDLRVFGVLGRLLASDLLPAEEEHLARGERGARADQRGDYLAACASPLVCHMSVLLDPRSSPGRSALASVVPE